MKFKTFYFENYNMNIPMDISNPRYVMSMHGVNDILTKIITHQPYTLEMNDFNNKNIVTHLLNIDVLQYKGNKLGIAVPVFIEKDYEILRELCSDVSKDIGRLLMKHKDEITDIISKIDNGFSNKRNLYHLLCGYIFDGKIFDFLEDENLITTSKLHTSNLDYLIVIYEDCKLLNHYSDRLLCSYNRLKTDQGIFSSFGDCEGHRKDFYRYYRLNELDELKDTEKKYVSFSPDELVGQFKRLIDGQMIEAKFLDTYTYFNYYENGKIIVPVYDNESFQVGDELLGYVLKLIKDLLINALSKIHQTQLTSISHLVDLRDIANEVYHIIFGEVNERLIENTMVEKPLALKGEGRYLKSFERLI